MASSTTMPMASTSPNSVKVLMLKPRAYMPANAPMSDTGTAINGIRVARNEPRKTQTTRNTSAIASRRVFTTSSIDTRTKRVESYGVAQAIPTGKRLATSFIVACTPSAVASELAPGCRKIAMLIAGLPLTFDTVS